MIAPAVINRGGDKMAVFSNAGLVARSERATSI
jgi:hypothetical protein